jgi:hypothetical protein
MPVDLKINVVCGLFMICHSLLSGTVYGLVNGRMLLHILSPAYQGRTPRLETCGQIAWTVVDREQDRVSRALVRVKGNRHVPDAWGKGGPLTTWLLLPCVCWPSAVFLPVLPPRFEGSLPDTSLSRKRREKKHKRNRVVVWREMVSHAWGETKETNMWRSFLCKGPHAPGVCPFVWLLRPTGHVCRLHLWPDTWTHPARCSSPRAWCATPV